MMALSSISIVTSSLLFKRWARPAHSVMPDERRALPEPMWVDAWERCARGCDLVVVAVMRRLRVVHRWTRAGVCKY
jgi:hypothetical protein